MYVCLSDNDENENGFYIVIKMYMYNRKYVLKFYDDDFSLVIRVCVKFCWKREALKFEFELIMTIKSYIKYTYRIIL